MSEKKPANPGSAKKENVRGSVTRLINERRSNNASRVTSEQKPPSRPKKP